MKIIYKDSIDNYIEAIKYADEVKGLSKFTKFIIRISLPLLLLVFTIMLYSSDIFHNVIILTTSASIGWVILAPSLMRKRILKLQIANMKNILKDDIAINGGTVIIEIYDNIFKIKNEIVTSEYKVSDIKEVLEYNKVLFVSLISSRDIIIPTIAFKDDIEKSNFINLLSKEIS